MGDRSERTAVGNLALDALRDELVITGDIGLEVTVLRVGDTSAGLHCAQRSHAPVALELLTVDEYKFTRRLGAAGQERAEHNAGCPSDQRLGDVTRILQSAVPNQWYASRATGLSRLVNGANLRDRSEEHTSELQSRGHLVCRLLL